MWKEAMMGKVNDEERRSKKRRKRKERERKKRNELARG